MRVIDVDSHFYEPVDWLRVHDAKLAEQVPDAVPFTAAIADLVGRLPLLMRAGVDLPIEEVPARGEDALAPDFLDLVARTECLQPDLHEQLKDPYYDAQARVSLNDELGIDVQFVNPTFLFTYLPGLLAAGRFDLIPSVYAAWNTFAAEQLRDHSDRLMPVSQGDLSDVEWTIHEMTRMRAAGSRAVNLTQPLDRSFTHTDFDRLWSAAEDLEMALYLHAGFAREILHPSWLINGRGPSTYGRLSGLALRLPVQAALGAMVFDEVFERHPRLTVIVAEAGHSWLPELLAYLDRATLQTQVDNQPMPSSYGLPLKPSEYLARQVRVSPLAGVLDWDGAGEEQILDTLARMPADAADMLVFSSDWPHLEGRQNAADVCRDQLPNDPGLHERFFGGSIQARLDL